MEQKPALKQIGSIYSYISSPEINAEISESKWDEFYEKLQNDSPEKLLNKYMEEDFPFVYPQLVDSCNLSKDNVFLEIGCGPMFLASQIAHKVKLVIGVDFSLTALLQAEKLMKKLGITNCLLLHGNIGTLPLNDMCVDVIYGGGVLEHFKDTSKAVTEMYRVLKPKGVAFNTVPHLNLGSLSYRQIWGNIPNLPVLKQLAELVHIKMLKSKHMRFGYELSFTASDLKKLHEKVGFKNVKVSHFKTRLVFENISNPIIRTSILWMADNLPMFKPMLKVVATK